MVRDSFVRLCNTTSLRQFVAVALLIAGLVGLVAPVGCSGDGGSGPADAGGLPDQTAPDTARDTADGASLQARVGPAGGAIDIPGGGRLTIPAGALGEEVTVAIRPIAAPDVTQFAAAGTFYEFTPAGLQFAVPATVELPIAGDLSAADVSRVVVAWSAAADDWELLRSDVDPERRLVSAAIAHFSQGGPALPVPEALVCCVIGAGREATADVQDAAACVAAGGTATAEVADCDPVCCGANIAGVAQAVLKPLVLCDHGWSRLDANLCRTVCCVGLGNEQGLVPLVGPGAAPNAPGAAPNAPGAAKLPQGVCQQAGGLELVETECDWQVCCGISVLGVSLAGKVPLSACEGGLGQVLDPQACESVCCVRVAGDTVAVGVLSLHACEQLGGLGPLPAEYCDELVCCAVSDPAGTLSVQIPRAMCEVGGTPTDAADCENTCCLIPSAHGAATATVVTHGTCEAKGGSAIAAAEACVDLVCCGAGEGPGSTGRMPRAVCTGAFSVLDEAECDKVCCIFEDGTTVTTMEASRAACEEKETIVIEEASLCTDLVCCAVTDGGETSETAIFPREWCELGGGSAVDASQCEQVCCALGGPDAAMVFTRHVCEQAGTVLGDAALCDEYACCGVGEGAGAWASRVIAATCTGDGQVLASEQCDSVCCVTGTSPLGPGAWPMARWTCAQLGGRPSYTMAECLDQVCCDSAHPIFGGAALLPAAMCRDQQGSVLDAAECAEVCCLFAGAEGKPESGRTARRNCEDAGGEVYADVQNCDDLRCCGVSGHGFEYAAWVPVEACTADGRTPLDEEDCEDVCCRTMDAQAFAIVDILSRWQCERAGGQFHENLEDCDNLVCCIDEGLDGIYAAYVTQMDCMPEDALEPDDCAQVCCRGEGMGDPGTVMARWTCETLFGIPSGGILDCVPECCLVQDTPQATTVAECEAAGGVAVPGGYCQTAAPRTCQRDSDCPNGGDACLAGHCEANGTCSIRVLDGTPCDDRDPCTTGDRCRAGHCEGLAVTCTVPNPPDPCVEATGYCYPGLGTCVYPTLPTDSPCDDGNPCTEDDRCYLDNTCQGQIVLCENVLGLPCIADRGWCNPGNGRCEYQPDDVGSPCDDFNFCTTLDVCQADGTCAGSPVVCDDPPEGCYAPIGTCQVSTGACEYTELETCDACCYDGERTLVMDTAAACTARGWQVYLPCVDPWAYDCVVPRCEDGQCAGLVAGNVGGECDDRDACTRGDTCDAEGHCVGNATSFCTISAEPLRASIQLDRCCTHSHPNRVSVGTVTGLAADWAAGGDHLFVVSEGLVASHDPVNHYAGLNVYIEHDDPGYALIFSALGGSCIYCGWQAGDSVRSWNNNHIILYPGWPSLSLSAYLGTTSGCPPDVTEMYHQASGSVAIWSFFRAGELVQQFPYEIVVTTDNLLDTWKPLRVPVPMDGRLTVRIRHVALPALGLNVDVSHPVEAWRDLTPELANINLNFVPFSWTRTVEDDGSIRFDGIHTAGREEVLWLWPVAPTPAVTEGTAVLHTLFELRLDRE